MRVENLSEKAEDFTGNVWLLVCQESEEVVLVDAGTGESWNQISMLEKVDKVVITHSHYDHVDNLPKIDDKYDPEIYSFNPDNLPVTSTEIDERERLELAGTKFDIFHTPGHKDDSICLHSPEEKILFTGDLLFPGGGFGRTDLEEGDRDVLIESIEKVADLDVEEMYCGHEKAVMGNAEKQIQKSLKEARKKEPKY